MRINVDCECGASLAAVPEYAGRRGVCPYCGKSITIPEATEPEIIDLELVPEQEPLHAEVVSEYLDPPRPADPQYYANAPNAADATAATTATPLAPAKPWMEVVLDNLLSPRSIRWLFVLGGALIVLGLVIWLASMNVFDDPRLVAGLLTAGSLGVYGVGLFVSLRTQHKMIGQALTFLGCVLTPLNLWYYHMQGLITLDSGLWIGGAACCVLYLVTVAVLRDPLFIYAVEAGVTLTAVLILGDVGLIDQSPAFSILFLALATVSILLERVFVAGDEKTRSFGLPFFWCGHVQLLVSVAVLLIVQMLGWMLVAAPAAAHWTWPGNLLTESALLTTTLWAIAAALYIYSDVVVRKLGLYALTGAFCLLMAEATLIGASAWAMEWRLALLSTTALGVGVAFYFVGRQSETASRFVAPCSLLLALPSVVLGTCLHFMATSLIVNELGLRYETGWDFVGVMIWSAACARVCSALFAKTHRFTSATFLFLSAAGVLAAGAGVLRMMGLVLWVHQAALLMLIPIGYIIAARVERGQAAEKPLGWVAHTGAAMILLASLLASLVDFGFRLDQLQVLQGSTDNLLLAAAFGAGTAFYVAAAYIRRRSANWWLASASAGATIWQLLVFVHAPLELLGPAFAILGIGLLFASRTMGLQSEERYTQSGTPYTTLTGPGRPWHEIGNGLLLAAWLTGLVGCAAAFTSYPDEMHWRPIAALFACVAFGATGAVAAQNLAWKYVHGLAAGFLFAAACMQLYLHLQLNPWRLMEYSLLALGLAMLIAAHIGRLREKPEQPNDLVTLGLVLGSLLATLPLFIAVLYHRTAGEGVSLSDELTFVTVAVVLLAAGVVFQTKAPVIVGALASAAYVLILLISLWQLPQIAIGVYLAIGGSLLFGTALLLSMYRERIAQMPKRFANREGVFQLLRWR